MKKTTRMLILAAALALLLALVATANAASGKCHPKNQECTTTTTTVEPESLGVGLSCKDYDDLNPGSVAPLTWNTGDKESQFPGSGEPPLPVKSGEVAPCIDFLSTKPGKVRVTVTSVEPVPKRNSVLAIVVKDSHPGDHCGAVVGDPEHSALNLNLKNETTGTETTGTIGGVPAATLNACGTPFAEAELDNGIVKPIITQDVDRPDPLAIVLFVPGKPGMTANVTLQFTPDVS
jgi:hypothetical protein